VLILTATAGTVLSLATLEVEVAIGGGGADTITGSTLSDLISGGGGADVLNGGAGFDYADYRDKATGVTVDLALTTAQPLADGDRLSGIEAVIGGAGADVLRGSSVANALYGEGGDDALDGKGGDDALFGGAGNDILTDTAGHNTLDGGDGDDVLTAGAGTDTLTGGAGDDVLAAGSGDDTLTGGAGDDSLSGGAGSNVYRFDSGEGRDVVEAQAGGTHYLIFHHTVSPYDLWLQRVDASGTVTADGPDLRILVLGYEQSVTVRGFFTSAAVHQIRVSDTGAYLSEAYVTTLAAAMAAQAQPAGPANDLNEAALDAVHSQLDRALARIWAGQDKSWYLTEGADVLNTPEQEDWVVALGGDDDIHGGNGDDGILGGWGHDLLEGANDDDLVYGGTGDDTIRGHAGNDYLSGDPGADLIEGGDGNDLLFGGFGDDVIRGGSGADRLVGEHDADTLDGGSGADTLLGGLGDDTLVGGADADTIEGGDGADTLDGGTGDDTLTGGPGADIYVVRRGDGVDRVTNGDDVAAPGEDTLRFLAGIDHDQLWLSRAGEDLVLAVIGTGQSVTVAGWWGRDAAAARIRRIEAGDGRGLDDEDVAGLLAAMDPWDPPAAGSLDLAPELETALRPALDAAWALG
jgi:Ca2+-binding RTX toxin-like protein